MTIKTESLFKNFTLHQYFGGTKIEYFESFLSSILFLNFGVLISNLTFPDIVIKSWEHFLWAWSPRILFFFAYKKNILLILKGNFLLKEIGTSFPLILRNDLIFIFLIFSIKFFFIF